MGSEADKNWDPQEIQDSQKEEKERCVHSEVGEKMDEDAVVTGASFCNLSVVYLYSASSGICSWPYTVTILRITNTKWNSMKCYM